MDGLCNKPATYYGLPNGNGTGANGVIPLVGPIVTSVNFSGNAAACPALSPSPSPHPSTAAVTECWQGAPSATYVALDQICNGNNASFYQVRRRGATWKDRGLLSTRPVWCSGPVGMQKRAFVKGHLVIVWQQ
jgi:hypothetical protein